LAYAVSWAWAFPFVAAGDVVKKGAGWPTHFPALLGPALAALVVTAVVWGRAGVRDLLARIARWRMPLRWWAPPQRSRCRAADHPDLGRLAPALLLHRHDLPGFPSGGLCRLRLRPRLRIDRAHLALQRYGRQHPRLCGLARPLQPRDWHRRRDRDDPGRHERVRLRASVLARRAGAACAPAWRSIGPRSPAQRRAAVQASHPLATVSSQPPLSFRERAVEQRGELPRSAIATAAAKGTWLPS